MQTKISALVFILIPFITINTKAADLGIKWSEIRIFGTKNNFSKELTDINNLTATDGVPKLDSLTGIGIEADGRVLPWLKVGTRITGILMSASREDAPMPATSYVTVQKYAGGILGRIPIVDKEYLLFDLVTELGISNNKIEIQTNAGKGTFTKNNNFYQRTGVSIGIGGPSIKFLFEAGNEWNNLSGITSEGNLTNNISSVDLSGPFFAAGIIISGIPAWIKPGGISVGK